MDKKLKNKITAALRKLSYQWEVRGQVLDASKSRECVGKYKNGKDKFLNMYKCNMCQKKFPSGEVQVDHKEPVIDPKVGFINWDTYITRLFCAIENLQVLCKRCHNIKTKRENQ